MNTLGPHAVRDLLRAALAEVGVELPPTQVAAATGAFRDLAKMLLAHRTDALWVVKCVEQIIVQAHYGDELLG